jgi:hypothetical protein
MHYTTIDDPRKDKHSNPRYALHHHWLPKSQRFEPTTMHYTTIDPQNVKIRANENALHLHWPPKDKNSNPRPRIMPPLMTPVKTNIWQRFGEPMTMHYHIWWPPKRQIFEPTTCTAPPLTPTKSKIRTQDHAQHHHRPLKSKTFEPTTMHTPPLTP